jgi:hypothetical protein
VAVTGFGSSKPLLFFNGSEGNHHRAVGEFVKDRECAAAKMGCVPNFNQPEDALIKLKVINKSIT